VKCPLLPFVCGRILPFTNPPSPSKTLNQLASIQFTEKRKIVFVKRHCNWSHTKIQTMKRHVYWELATSLNITDVWVCVWVSLCVCDCVTFSCDSHTIPPICRFWNLNIHVQFIRCLQWIFISWPDLCINQTNCSLRSHIIRGWGEYLDIRGSM